ncbi:3-mercaptopyruvate sulfurtransferase [Novosphingobium sp. FSY-8]|uniref:Sulfurtransferase n=1 Tax=Novosphingobium ovatum TaxID=1908523 RepID=A0ABW9XE97_9SPHN|nr:3-mercaptopyruvate sulfurtransferase [Novosphingobium ovatum]NBC36869.1 3-mercaptopyruvate sulfurtransferase [Novosphingobium ovatum]
MDSLVSTDWLANEMAACDLRIVDASSHLPDAGRNALAEHEAGHIPGAVFMDLAELVDTASAIENTLPSAEKFASRMAALGLGDGSRIVVYDDSGIRTAARAWFMLKLFGAQNVAILDGGLAKWRAEGRDLETGRRTLRHRHYTAWQDGRRLRDKAQVLANLATPAEAVVDARGAPRFLGGAPEPRPGITPGHIPGSANVPYASLFNADGTYKDKAGLSAAFSAGGVDLSRPVVVTCGSGMTACVLAFGLHLLGKQDVALYDGSWAEWGSDPTTPKAVGSSKVPA